MRNLGLYISNRRALIGILFGIGMLKQPLKIRLKDI